jgi:hypothetical protein
VLRTRFGMPFYDIDILDHNPVFASFYAQHFTDLALVFTDNYFYLVVLFNMAFIVYHKSFPPRAKTLRISTHPGFQDQKLISYKTSGASEMIFINLLARSSLATGPKIRVPTGSLLG